MKEYENFMRDPDLGFMIEWDVHSHHVEFGVVDCVLGTNADQQPVYLYLDENDRRTTDRREAAVYLHGEVKWDGCSNWYIDEQERCMLHFCSLKGIERLSDVMKRCWVIASEELSNFQGEE